MQTEMDILLEVMEETVDKLRQLPSLKMTRLSLAVFLAGMAGEIRKRIEAQNKAETEFLKELENGLAEEVILDRGS